MNRARGFSSACLGFILLLLPGLAYADGEDTGYSWGDCVVSPAHDGDQDGLDDACEYAIAKAFEPELVFGPEETAPEREPFFAARPDGYGTLRIFYALSYFRDAGDPTFGGISGHDGDSEFIVLRVRHVAGTNWELVDAYLSAHYMTSCDAGGWYGYERFDYTGPYRGHPTVWLAEGKHANYVNSYECDLGGCHQDHCGDVVRERVGLTPGHDLGLLGAPLIDRTVRSGNEEWFWTDVVFCGWRHSPTDGRDGCVPDANSYAKELFTFEMFYGPVGTQGLCGPCGDDIECSNGGLCRAAGGTSVCGRECDGHACPAGFDCTVSADGASQCVPRTGTCDCYLQCDGRRCGPDGCGGSCGTCPAGSSCDSSGQCVGSGLHCDACPTGVECAPGYRCMRLHTDVEPYCVKQCGDGTCPHGAVCTTLGADAVCLPDVAHVCRGTLVGTQDSCGRAFGPTTACAAGQSCSDGGCVCVPHCDARTCGDDGCGGSCGVCGAGQVCAPDAGACIGASEPGDGGLDGGTGVAAGGCGCRAVGRAGRTLGNPGWIALGVTLALAWRRRRSRQR